MMKWFGKVKNVHWSLMFVVIACIFQGVFQYAGRAEVLDFESLCLMTCSLLASIACFMISIKIFHASNTSK